MKTLKSNKRMDTNLRVALPRENTFPTRVALISDIHQDNDQDNQILSQCLENIYHYNQTHQVLIVGGLADNVGQTQRIVQTVDGVIASKLECDTVVMPGKQDIQGGNSGNIGADGVNLYRRDMQKLNAYHYPETHCIDYWLNGYHFIVLNTDRGASETLFLSPASLQWLQNCLAQNAHPHKPIFIMLHQALGFTHRQTEYSATPATHDEQLKKIFEHYPQLVVISGHTQNGFGAIEFMQRTFGTLVEVPSLTRTRDGEKRNGTGWLLQIDPDRLNFEAWNFLHKQPIEKFHFTVSLPQLPVLVEKTARLPEIMASSFRERADRLLYRVYQNALPLSGPRLVNQNSAPADNIYAAAVWQDIESLRNDILDVVYGGKNVNSPAFTGAAKPLATVKPEIMALAAKYENGLLTIEWRNDESTSPQRHYEIELRRQGLQGELMARQSAAAPEQRKAVIAIQDPLPEGEYYFTLMITNSSLQRSDLHYDHFTCDGEYSTTVKHISTPLMNAAV